MPPLTRERMYSAITTQPCALSNRDIEDSVVFVHGSPRSPYHYICSRIQHPPLTLEPFVNGEAHTTPILFTMVGQLSRDDCHLYPNKPDVSHPEPPVVSFWLESRPDIESKIEFLDLRRAFAAISQEADNYLKLDLLLREDPIRGCLQLQVVWLPWTKEEANNLLIMDANGDSAVPNSTEDIPFDIPVRVSFWLQYVLPRNTHHIPRLCAGLVSLRPF
ncbi:hypothetical protein BXZ70DRAFT_1007175 [Cristinia sonorae]|uniref:Uncharacterized protein n=1 Tax=Cristinia sonorae TaxID=1940300 RepID=A0A8K0UQP9_9AGAR|nr:hypothetical protein BXZ70DRAFT_1007175 [Cristinia sonorae]